MVLDLCSKIWDLVSPVLTNDSPEGNLYVMIDVEPSTTSALRDATAQDLLSSSWRSLKEASSLLGTVLASSNSSYEDYQAAGTLFIEWLTRIRHRGAFSAVMPSFESLCSECFKYREMNVKNLPGQWLNVRHLKNFPDSEMSFVDKRENSFNHSSLRRFTDAHYSHPRRRS